MSSNVASLSPSHQAPYQSEVSLYPSEESLNDDSCHSNVAFEGDGPGVECSVNSGKTSGAASAESLLDEEDLPKDRGGSIKNNEKEKCPKGKSVNENLVGKCSGSDNSFSANGCSPSSHNHINKNLNSTPINTQKSVDSGLQEETYLSGEVSTVDSAVDKSLTPSLVESRRGTAVSESGTLPLGMQPEETPIFEGNQELSGKIVGRNGLNGQPDKLDHPDDDGVKWQSMKMGMAGIRRPFMQKHNPIPIDSTLGDKIKYSLMCPPHGKIGLMLTYILLFALFWGSLVYITKEQALPGGTLFSLLVLVVCAQIAGVIVSKFRLPPLLGMLLVGIMFRSAPWFDVIGANIQTEWSSSLRSMALVVILIRAGLGLDPDALRKLSFVVLRLAMIPCLVEASTVAVVSHLLLDFPWKWGFLLGFVLSAVSPAVVVPCLLNLSEQGYGVEKGIPTLVIAAASIDDVLAISGFGVCLGMIFSEGSALWQGMKGPLEIGMGIIYGLVIGMLLWILPNKKHENAIELRVILLFCAGLLAVFGSKGIDFGGAGALACLCVAFVAGYGWRKQGKIPNKTQVNEYFNFMWMFFQPMLFGLIGTEIRISDLQMSTVGWGVITLLIGLTLRVIVSFFAVLGGNLTIKERFFVALAWLPKATVQAAIGSTALDYARDANKGALVESVEEIMGAKVLTIAVLVILITAPIGAIAIMLSAPKLLKKAPKNPEGKEMDDVES